MMSKILEAKKKVLTEYESKQFLASYGIPTSREILVQDRSDLLRATEEIGFPLVLKGCGQNISHKTEQNLVFVDIRTDREAQTAFDSIRAKIGGLRGGVLVQKMISGRRELMAGMTRDPQFGPCVMFGLGGIFTEILRDVVFRVAPLQERDAIEMMKGIKAHRILEAIRGMEEVNREIMANILITVGQIGLENERVTEIDINPLIVHSGVPVAVDALVVLDGEELE